MKLTAQINALLAYISTFGYLLIAIMTAHVPSIGIALTALRDSWIFLGIYLIAVSNNIYIITFTLLCVIFGAIGSFFGDYSFNFMIFSYGIRDIIFVATIFTLLHSNPAIFRRIHGIRVFIFICVLLTIFETVMQIFGYNDVSEKIFSSSSYFSAKGIESNVQGGIFGSRITAPLYSSSLIATMYCLFFAYTKSNAFLRWVSLASSALTMSKVVPMIMIFGVFKKYPIIVLSVVSVVVVAVYPTLVAAIYQFPNTVISFHAASILDRYNSFFNFPELSKLLDLNHIGMSSPAGQVISGGDASSAPESLIISKIFDMGVYFIIPFFFLMASVFKLKGSYLSFGIVFLFLQTFSSLSNHLVAFIPIVILMKQLELSSVNGELK